MDLADESRPLLAQAREAGVPLWCDLHDYDGTNPFHQDFVEAADVLFLNEDGMPDPLPWMGAGRGGHGAGGGHAGCPGGAGRHP